MAIRPELNPQQKRGQNLLNGTEEARGTTSLFSSNTNVSKKQLQAVEAYLKTSEGKAENLALLRVFAHGSGNPFLVQLFNATESKLMQLQSASSTSALPPSTVNYEAHTNPSSLHRPALYDLPPTSAWHEPPALDVHSLSDITRAGYLEKAESQFIEAVEAAKARPGAEVPAEFSKEPVGTFMVHKDLGGKLSLLIRRNSDNGNTHFSTSSISNIQSPYDEKFIPGFSGPNNRELSFSQWIPAKLEELGIQADQLILFKPTPPVAPREQSPEDILTNAILKPQQIDRATSHAYLETKPEGSFIVRPSLTDNTQLTLDIVKKTGIVSYTINATLEGFKVGKGAKAIPVKEFVDPELRNIPVGLKHVEVPTSETILKAALVDPKSLSREESYRQLNGKQEGSFIVRNSRQEGKFALDVVKGGTRVSYQIAKTTDGSYAVDGEKGAVLLSDFASPQSHNLPAQLYKL